MDDLFNKYRKVASSNTSRLEAHAGFFRLLMKGIRKIFGTLNLRRVKDCQIPLSTANYFQILLPGGVVLETSH